MNKIGLIGLGPMGKRHCEALKMIQNAELVAVCDLVEEHVHTIMKDYCVKNGYTNFDKMLDVENIDMLIVSTNGPSHANLVIKAAESDVKRILCEKPMATCINDAELMIQICEKNDVRLTINHLRRFMPPYQKLKDSLEKDIIGDIRHITFEMAGGQMGSNGGHFLDLVRFLTDSEPDKLIGFIDKSGTLNPRGKQYVDPGAYGLILMNNGCRVFFDMSEDYGVPSFVEIMGTLGRVLIDEKACKWEVSARKKEDRNQSFTRRPPLETIPFEGERLDMILGCKNAIVELLESKKISCTGNDGLISLEMTVAIHKSEGRNNQFVSFPLKDFDKTIHFNFT